MTAAAQYPQSDDDRLRVVQDAQGGACWEICSGGVCLQDRSGARVMKLYRALLVSQGRPAPIS